MRILFLPFFLFCCAAFLVLCLAQPAQSSCDRSSSLQDMLPVLPAGGLALGHLIRD